MRTLALDLGSKRIGVAISDVDGRLALAYEVLERSGDRVVDHRRIAVMVTETESELVVVGLPLSLDGSLGPAAQGAMAEITELEARLAVPVANHDERFTTVSADRELREAGLDGKARRKVIDKVAAEHLLQAWLDSRRTQAASS